MSKTRLVITAVVIQNRAVPEVAAEYGVSRSWLYELLAGYRREGDAAFEPRSRRPKRTPNATPEDVVELIVELRAKLSATGLDSGPDTIGWHLEHHHGITVARATISRHLAARGLVAPEPKSGRSRPTSGSPPSCPTSAGRPTSPTTGSLDRTVDPARTQRS